MFVETPLRQMGKHHYNQLLAVTKNGTGTGDWDVGLGDMGTWGSGTWGRGDVGMWGRGDSGMW